MEKNFTEQVTDILDEFRAMHRQIDQTKDSDTFVLLLDLTQQNAVHLGNAIEAALPDSRSVISVLQDYCEALYQLSLKADEPVEGENRDVALNLDSYIDRVAVGIRRLAQA